MDTNLFFELLQMALGTRDGLSRVPSAAEWEWLLEEAERQAVVGVMLGGLQRCMVHDEGCMVNLPIDLKLQWIGEVQMDEAVFKTHCERAAELTSRFRAVGFKSCILKGVGTAQYYPEPSRRQCGDIDLWVDGRRKDVMAWLRSQYEIGLVVWHHTEAMVFDDVATEIHLHPAWMYGPSRNRKLQRFFENESDGWHETGRGFNVPGVRFDAVFSLVHSFHHLLEEGIGLRHVVDYFYVLKKCHTDRTDLTDILRVLRSIGLGKFTSAMMWVLGDVCGMPASELLCEPDKKEGRFLLREIMAGGNFGQMRQDGKDRNTIGRWMMMVKHYPSEVLWMIPWKCWHRVWRMVNG